MITALFLENTHSVEEGIGCDDGRVVSSDSEKINVCLCVRMCAEIAHGHTSAQTWQKLVKTVNLGKRYREVLYIIIEILLYA